MANIQITDELLSKYFAGEALPEEAMAIDDWKNSHADNASLFNASWDAWQMTSAHPYTKPDLQAIWQQTNSKRPKKIRILPWAAAAAALITAVALIWLQQRRPVTMTIAATQQTITQTLPDGSMAKVTPGSSISYTNRTIQLKGNGDFDVKPDPGQPFIVQAGPVQITVLGTKFHVEESDSLVIVQVSSGKVMMDKAGKDIIVAGGQMGYYKAGTLVLENYHFTFDNNSLGSILERLSMAYHKKIVLQDPAMAELRISSVFENKPLDYMLEVITSTLNLKYSYRNGDEIYIEEE
jgi:ferric-dicitrate binding protein FerR (iron transport regulator)